MSQTSLAKGWQVHLIKIKSTRVSPCIHFLYTGQQGDITRVLGVTLNKQARTYKFKDIFLSEVTHQPEKGQKLVGNINQQQFPLVDLISLFISPCML